MNSFPHLANMSQHPLEAKRRRTYIKKRCTYVCRYKDTLKRDIRTYTKQRHTYICTIKRDYIHIRICTQNKKICTYDVHSIKEKYIQAVI